MDHVQKELRNSIPLIRRSRLWKKESFLQKNYNEVEWVEDVISNQCPGVSSQRTGCLSGEDLWACKALKILRTRATQRIGMPGWDIHACLDWWIDEVKMGEIWKWSETEWRQFSGENWVMCSAAILLQLQWIFIRDDFRNMRTTMSEQINKFNLLTTKIKTIANHNNTNFCNNHISTHNIITNENKQTLFSTALLVLNVRYLMQTSHR